MVRSCGFSDVGCVRQENEDRILMDDRLSLFVVADGMGGHRCGELAAELGVSTVRYYIDSSRDRLDVTWPFGYDFERSLNENRLSTALQLANRQVWRQSEESPDRAGMGTTLAAVLIDEDRAAIASVGDSRVYLLRAGELSALTVDDNWVGELVRQGALDAEGALNHPLRNVLTQAAGSKEMIQVHTREQVLREQDLLLVSTDGLHGIVEEAAIRSVLGAGDSLERTAARLLEATRSNGAPDNVSCILVAYSAGPDGGS